MLHNSESQQDKRTTDATFRTNQLATVYRPIAIHISTFGALFILDTSVVGDILVSLLQRLISSGFYLTKVCELSNTVRFTKADFVIVFNMLYLKNRLNYLSPQSNASLPDFYYLLHPVLRGGICEFQCRPQK